MRWRKTSNQQLAFSVQNSMNTIELMKQHPVLCEFDKPLQMRTKPMKAVDSHPMKTHTPDQAGHHREYTHHNHIEARGKSAEECGNTRANLTCS